MKKYKVLLILSLLILSSCSLFVEKSYQRDICVNKLVNHLKENGWREISSSKTRKEFKRGASVVPTFDYESEDLEVQLFIEKNDNQYIIEVGNYGLLIELNEMKPRFIRISNYIDKYISKNCSI